MLNNPECFDSTYENRGVSEFSVIFGADFEPIWHVFVRVGGSRGGAGLGCEYVWEMCTGILPRQVLTLNMQICTQGAQRSSICGEASNVRLAP